MATATLTRREQLEKAVAGMQACADEIDEKGSTPTAEDLERLNKHGDEVLALKEAVLADAKAGGTLDMANAFLGDLAAPPADQKSPDQKAQDVLAAQTGIVNPQGMTLGEAFSKSPVYEDFVKQYKGSDGQIREVTNLKTASFDVPGFNQKTVVTGLSDTSGGAFVRPFRFPSITDLIGERRLTVRDLCTNISISSDVFEYVTITGKTNNAATVLEATQAADDAAYGTPDAGKGSKPESALALAVVSAIVETIAHMIPITRRAAADAPQVRDLVDAFLLYGLKEEEEDQILNGNGTSPNLAGITDFAISTVGSAGTDLDAIVDAIRTIRGEFREPSAMVIHPNDWYSTGFLLAKETTGGYLLNGPAASIDAQTSLWGLRVVVTPAMTENTVLVGDFKQYVIADRQQAAIYVTDSHKDWFQRNILAVLAEERLAGGCLDPKAFCSVTAV